MYFLAILGFGMLYVIGGFLVMWLLVAIARQYGWCRWPCALTVALVALAAYHTPLAHFFVVDVNGPEKIFHQLCYRESGFWLYKTPQKWMSENPGVAQTLERDGRSEDIKGPDGGFMTVFHLNQRFDWRIQPRLVSHNVHRQIQTVVDRASGEVMAKRVDFSFSASQFHVIDTCFQKSERERWLVDGRAFGSYLEIIEKLGERK